jgi:hypothetical protein
MRINKENCKAAPITNPNSLKARRNFMAAAVVAAETHRNGQIPAADYPDPLTCQ